MTDQPIAMPRVLVVHSFLRASFAERGLSTSAASASRVASSAIAII